MSERAERRAIAALLLGTLALGAFLRLQLAGVASGVGTFAFLRHTHSHLGYYGVLFPLLWIGWRAAGGRALGPRELAVYLAATVVSVVGFAWRGYFVVSIVGSSVVGAGWLLAAWRNRAWLREVSSWRFSGPPAVVIAACFVPPIAVFTRRDPAFAQELVRTFLGVLVFGVFVPGALARLRAPALPGPLWLACALAASAWLGVGVHPLLSAGLLACGAWLTWATARAAAPLWLRAVWLGLSLGALALAAGLVPKSHALTIAALHYAFLGPLLLTWARDVAPPPPWLVAVWLAGVLLLSAAVVLGAAQVAAGAGALVLATALVGVATRARA